MEQQPSSAWQQERRSADAFLIDRVKRLDEGQLEILRRLDVIERHQAVMSAALGLIRWLGPIVVATLFFLAGRFVPAVVSPLIGP